MHDNTHHPFAWPLMLYFCTETGRACPLLYITYPSSLSPPPFLLPSLLPSYSSPPRLEAAFYRIMKPESTFIISACSHAFLSWITAESDDSRRGARDPRMQGQTHRCGPSRPSWRSSVRVSIITLSAQSRVYACRVAKAKHKEGRTRQDIPSQYQQTHRQHLANPSRVPLSATTPIHLPTQPRTGQKGTRNLRPASARCPRDCRGSWLRRGFGPARRGSAC